MPTPRESARLDLELFALRREPVLRGARAWCLAGFTETVVLGASDAEAVSSDA